MFADKVNTTAKRKLAHLLLLLRRYAILERLRVFIDILG
jgi:hypothetical protein